MEITQFKNEQFGIVRTVVIDNQPWFVGRDVAIALGYSCTNKPIIDHVDDDDKLYLQLSEIQGCSKTEHPSASHTKVVVINESGLYSLILGSKLETAREFKHWVTSEVLPQIRRTGGYIPVTAEDDEKTILARAVEILQRTLAKKEALLAEQRPKVVFAEAVTSAEDSILIRDLAKLLTQNGVVIGQNRLFAWMRFNGYLFQNENRPIQKWVEEGLFDTTVTMLEFKNRMVESCVTKVTGKGQAYFVNGFLSGKFKLGV